MVQWTAAGTRRLGSISVIATGLFCEFGQVLSLYVLPYMLKEDKDTWG